MNTKYLSLMLLFYHTLTVASPFAYISNQLDNTVDVIDLSLNQTIKTIKVAGAPAGVASGHHNNKIYVTTPENGSFVIINSQTQAVVKTVYIGGAPLGIAIDHKDNYVYIADWYSNKVHVFDAKQQQLVDTILVGQSPSGLVLSVDNSHLFVANRLSNSVSKINLATRLVEKTTAVGTHPFGLAIDTQFIYSANVVSHDISVLDINNLELVAHIDLAEDSLPYALTLALNNQRLLVTHQGDSYVGVIDTKNKKYIASIEVGDKPEGISTHPQNDQLVYVANWFDDTVSLIDVSKLATIKTIKVGKGARSFGKFIIP